MTLSRMAASRTLTPTPLTFELPRSLVERIHVCRGRLQLKSVSDVVRQAVERFDFAGFQTAPREQLQISVRLSSAQKRVLFQHARRKRVSAGELLRAALEALVPDGDGRLARRAATGKRRGKKRA